MRCVCTGGGRLISWGLAGRSLPRRSERLRPRRSFPGPNRPVAIRGDRIRETKPQPSAGAYSVGSTDPAGGVKRRPGGCEPIEQACLAAASCAGVVRNGAAIGSALVDAIRMVFCRKPFCSARWGGCGMARASRAGCSAAGGKTESALRVAPGTMSLGVARRLFGWAKSTLRAPISAASGPMEPPWIALTGRRARAVERVPWRAQAHRLIVGFRSEGFGGLGVAVGQGNFFRAIKRNFSSAWRPGRTTGVGVQLGYPPNEIGRWMRLAALPGA